MNITDLDAHALSAALHARQLSCREVMQAYLSRIHALNPKANAIVNLAADDTLLRQADEHDALLAQGRSRGWLHGVPQAIKDTAHALGFPSTLGSPIWKDLLPAVDSLFVQRMKAAGCIVVGKTNMPEFGLGSHTVNPLFGPTPNAWDESVTAGGSSGGAAVALALRLLPVADGSDFMGSLRNPAGWNHVIGLRPSQGRVPAWPKPECFVSQLGSDGPMGRSVRDVAALLQTQSGHDPRVPLSINDGPQNFMPPADASARGLRIGWLGSLGGHLAMEDGVLAVCEQALQRLAGDGAIVEPLALGFDADAVWHAWLLWRRALVAPSVAAALAQPGATRAMIKPEALWEHDQAQDLSQRDFMQAATVRSNFYQHLLGLYERFDLLALPVAQMWPFALGEAWPRTLAGRTMDTYHRWMEVTIYATFAGLPAISLPAGFHANGRWPMGLQLIGRPQGDAALLHAAQAYENQAGELMARRPGSWLRMIDATLKTLHVLAVVLWVGGMVFAHFFLRPALAVLAPPDRLRLMHAVLQRFFGAVLVASLLTLATGLALIGHASAQASASGGRFSMPLAWTVMATGGVVMVAIFLVIRLALFPRLARAVAASDWPAGAAALAQVRQWVLVNLVLGTAVLLVTLLRSAF